MSRQEALLLAAMSRDQFSCKKSMGSHLGDLEAAKELIKDLFLQSSPCPLTANPWPHGLQISEFQQAAPLYWTPTPPNTHGFRGEQTQAWVWHFLLGCLTLPRPQDSYKEEDSDQQAPSNDLW